MPTTPLDALHIYIHLTLTPWDRYYYYPYLLDNITEVQKTYVTFLNHIAKDG